MAAVNPLEPTGIYVERSLGGTYDMEVVTLGGASSTVTMPGISPQLLAAAYVACMQELSKHYASDAIDADAATPGKIFVPPR